MVHGDQRWGVGGEVGGSGRVGERGRRLSGVVHLSRSVSPPRRDPRWRHPRSFPPPPPPRVCALVSSHFPVPRPTRSPPTPPGCPSGSEVDGREVYDPCSHFEAQRRTCRRSPVAPARAGRGVVSLTEVHTARPSEDRRVRVSLSSQSTPHPSSVSRVVNTKGSKLSSSVSVENPLAV